MVRLERLHTAIMSVEPASLMLQLSKTGSWTIIYSYFLPKMTRAYAWKENSFILA